MRVKKEHNTADKFGKVNITIALICIIGVIVNSVLVEENALMQISTNKTIAYILNFLAGCEGLLGTFGAMSYPAVFEEGQWWRLLTHIYLHAGILHMAFNICALLFAGKVVEKKLGSIRYAFLFHAIAVVDAIVVSLIYRNSTSVGASAGIFGAIGVVCVWKLRKDNECREYLKKGEWFYLIIFSLLSLLLGMESFVLHLIALVMGILAGIAINKSNSKTLNIKEHQ